jgi:uncharacterized membrane-anchored protein
MRARGFGLAPVFVCTKIVVTRRVNDSAGVRHICAHTVRSPHDRAFSFDNFDISRWHFSCSEAVRLNS